MIEEAMAVGGGRTAAPRPAKFKGCFGIGYLPFEIRA
jgi:hypothetical protein